MVNIDFGKLENVIGKYQFYISPPLSWEGNSKVHDKS